MAEYKNSGILGKNKRKREGKRDPDYSGSVDAVVCAHCKKESDYWLSGWLRESQKDGSKFFSLSLTAKKEKGGSAAADDDDLPF
jgi:hypothetical protein